MLLSGVGVVFVLFGMYSGFDAVAEILVDVAPSLVTSKVPNVRVGLMFGYLQSSATQPVSRGTDRAVRRCFTR